MLAVFRSNRRGQQNFLRRRRVQGNMLRRSQELVSGFRLCGLLAAGSI